MSSFRLVLPHRNILNKQTNNYRSQHPVELNLIGLKRRHSSINFPSSLLLSSLVEYAPRHPTSYSNRFLSGSTNSKSTSLIRPQANPAPLFHRSHFPLYHPHPDRTNNRSTASISHFYSAQDGSDRDLNKLTGQECYDRALQALQTKRIREEETEEQAAREQYEAMERSFQKTHDRTTFTSGDGRGAVDSETVKAEKRGKISASVAVVRTITRQTRSKKKNGIQQGNRKSEVAKDDLAVENEENDDLLEEAQKYMQHAAFLYGHKDALVRLGNEALDVVKGQKSKGIGNVDGTQLYTHILGNGGENAVINVEKLRSIPSAMDRALKLYELAGERGSTEGWYNCGHLLWEIAHSEKEDIKNDNNENCFDNYSESSSKAVVSALEAFRNAMELGDSDAAYFLGVQYLQLSEDGVWSKYLVELEHCESLAALNKYGLELIQRAGEKYGHGGALHYMALLHLNGDERIGIIPCSIDDFPRYLNKAADSGDADALFLRAYCLYNGEEGYNQDFSAALEEFIKSGEAGNADGFVSAGAMLHRGGYGSAMRQDQRKAFELYQEAAEMGSKEAWRNLVACYSLGEGIPKCEQTAKYIAKTMLNDDDDR